MQVDQSVSTWTLIAATNPQNIGKDQISSLGKSLSPNANMVTQQQSRNRDKGKGVTFSNANSNDNVEGDNVLVIAEMKRRRVEEGNKDRLNSSGLMDSTMIESDDNTGGLLSLTGDTDSKNEPAVGPGTQANRDQ